MSVLKQFQADLKKLQTAHQRKLMVEALRNRAHTLTLGDIRSLLASPLGAGLAEVRLAVLFDPSPSDGPGRRQSAKPRAATTPKANAKRAGRKRKKQAKKGARPARNTVDAVWELLRTAGKPIGSAEIASKLDVHPSTVITALKKLRAAKRVVVSGTSRSTRYTIQGPSIAPLLQPEVPPAGASPTTRTTMPPSPAEKGQVDFDAAVLKAMGQNPVSSTMIKAAVGGTIDAVRMSLQRLITAGRVVRTGERKLTRYALKSPA